MGEALLPVRITLNPRLLSIPFFQSHVKEASGDRGQNAYKYLEWPGILEVHAGRNHQGAEESQPRVL